MLFCDLVGSTARAERLDPEDVRALLSRYHARVRQELERFGGTVEKFIGDAVVALAILAGELGRAADLLEVGGDKTLAANSRLEAARRGALDQLEPALAFFRSVGASRYVLEGEALRSSASARMQTSTTTGSN